MAGRRTAPWAAVAALLIAGSACRGTGGSGEDAGVEAGAVPSAAASQAGALSPLVVDHGELDTLTPDDAPQLAATVIAATIYKLPDADSRKLGYIRLGGLVRRDPAPVSGKGCEKEWYRIYPMGHVCTDEATTNLEDPLVRATGRRADLTKPLPYRYGFVRATAPQYLRVPTRKEQFESEMSLQEHLDWYAKNRAEVQAVTRGANDVPLDARGMPGPGVKPPAGYRPPSEMTENELYGGTQDESIPWWLEGGRKIPNVSGFEVPSYAVFADRVRRKTGLSFVGAFQTQDGDLTRRFAVTVDMRLIPTTKVKPDSGSPFHGLEITERTPLPFAFVVKRDSHTWKLIKGRDEARQAEAIPKRVVVPLSGTARIKAGKRFYQTSKDRTRWLRASDIGIVAVPREWPEVAERGEKWIHISIGQQTLVLYEGKRPWYATLVSTGRDRLKDPKTSLATPRGDFRLRSKHVAAAMDADENTSVSGGRKSGRRKVWSAEAQATIDRLRKAEEEGRKLSDEDRRRVINIKKGRHPEYGVTMRRGAGDFELRDVPWIQYFASGYAIHGAYWHDVFGIPRSHGCVNLAPVDARILFFWTDPPVPEGWHGVNIGADMGEGTTVVIRE